MQETFSEPCNAYYSIYTDKTSEGYKYRFLSPFEFKDVLLKSAAKSVGKDNVIDGGRGNPIFYSTIPRYAFSLLMNICTRLGELDNSTEEHLKLSEAGIAFMPTINGIGSKFDQLLSKYKKTSEGKFLKKACNKMRLISGMDKDHFVHDLVISTIGCYYPNPPRIQQFVEPVLTDFLDKCVYRSNKPLKGKVNIMTTEGCGAAILYLFDSLKYNGLVIPGDKIGVLTPIFSPYLEIPALKNYDLTQICIQADDSDNWDIPQTEIDKIADPDMKALFIVNPTNPTGLSLSSKTVKDIARVVKTQNPNLIIIEDNVYAPFVEEFNDFFNVLPKNTIGVFSLSKYFGVTGWRLGSIIMHKNNIIDGKLLNPKFRIDAENLYNTNQRYKMLSNKPESIKFIDRVLADSRQIAEAHIAGLSTPQQTLMTLFAMFELMDRQRKYYKTLTSMLSNRMKDLLDPIRYEIEESDLNTNYYLVLDISKVADNLMGGTEFGDYLREHRDPLDFLLDLAKKYGTVLLPAVEFAGPFWGVRVSLANRKTEDYHIIGENLRSLIDDYYKDFKKYERKRLRQIEQTLTDIYSETQKLNTV